jgi:hypothetical protein
MTYEPRILIELTPGQVDALLNPDCSATGDRMAAEAKLRKALAVERGPGGSIAKADAEQKAAIEAETGSFYSSRPPF